MPHPDSALGLALAVVRKSSAPLLLLDESLTIVAASDSFCAAFGVAIDSAVGATIGAVGQGEWNVPQLLALLKATATGLAAITDYEFDLKRDGQGDRCLIVNAHKLNYSDDDPVRLLLGIVDVTDLRAEASLREQLVREKAILLLELQHRVANSLQIIASVLMQSARRSNSDEIRGHLHDAHSRVMSVAALQRQLTLGSEGDVQIGPYLTTLCSSIGASMIRDHAELSITVTGNGGGMPAPLSISLGLVATELVINALKHAFPQGRKGAIIVDFSSHGADWTLAVADNGIGMHPAGVAKAGLGTSIVTALAEQLHARIVITDAEPGTKVSLIHIALSAANEDARDVPIAAV